MEKFIPICEFCGQIHDCERTFNSQKEANAFASLNCTCLDSHRSREQVKRAEVIHSAIDYMFEGEESVCPAEYINTLYEVGDTISRGLFSSAKIAIVGGGTISISINSKRKVKIKRSVTVKNEFNEEDEEFYE